MAEEHEQMEEEPEQEATIDDLEVPADASEQTKGGIYSKCAAGEEH